jgi:hypothetical protein
LESAVELSRRELQAHAGRIGRAVCDVLNENGVEGGGWRHRVNEVYFVSLALFHPRGLHLSLTHENSHRKADAGRRLTVRGVYPSEYGGRTADRITVGMDTSAAHMASRITRLLLPTYLKYLDVALADQRKAESDKRARRAMNHRMRQALPALHAASWESEYTAASRTQSFWTNGSYNNAFPPALASGSVRLSTNASDAEIRIAGVPAELVLRILALLDPNPPLEGTVMPRAVAPVRRPLSAVRIVPGEVLESAAPPATDPGPCHPGH